LELGKDLTDAVLADWRTAPVSGKVNAMLGYLERLTLEPDALTPADLEPMRAAGISDQAIRDASAVCVAFSMITRLADSFDFKVRDARELAIDAKFLLKMGYDK
jgi:alkylhydroperoxidase family enzyme